MKYHENINEYNELKDSFEKLDICNTYCVNNWLTTKEPILKRINEDYICMQDESKGESIEFEYGDSLEKYLDEHLKCIMKLLNEKFTICLSIINLNDLDKKYEGIIKKINDTELILKDGEVNLVIKKVNYKNFEIDDCQVFKIISKQKTLMKVSEYINMIKNNEGFKFYKHKFHIVDEYGKTKSLDIVLKDDEVLYYKDRELKKIKDIPNNYLDNYIICVTMTIN